MCRSRLRVYAQCSGLYSMCTRTLYRGRWERAVTSTAARERRSNAGGALGALWSTSSGCVLVLASGIRELDRVFPSCVRTSSFLLFALVVLGYKRIHTHTHSLSLTHTHTRAHIHSHSLTRTHTLQSGRAHAIGVSNFEKRHLQDLLELEGVLLPAVNQV